MHRTPRRQELRQRGGEAGHGQGVVGQVAAHDHLGEASGVVLRRSGGYKCHATSNKVPY